MNLFDLGEWINFPFKHMNQNITLLGYIKDIDLDKEMYKVQVTNFPSNSGMFLVPFNLAKQPVINLESEDYKNIIDFSLDTKDIEWFNELVKNI